MHTIRFIGVLQVHTLFQVSWVSYHGHAAVDTYLEYIYIGRRGAGGGGGGV
jgi:hypothetical protein